MVEGAVILLQHVFVMLLVLDLRLLAQVHHDSAGLYAHSGVAAALVGLKLLAYGCSSVH
jgi:hypothetical protein